MLFAMLANHSPFPVHYGWRRDVPENCIALYVSFCVVFLFIREYCSIFASNYVLGKSIYGICINDIVKEVSALHGVHAVCGVCLVFM
jgi:hypothetical protein